MAIKKVILKYLGFGRYVLFLVLQSVHFLYLETSFLLFHVSLSSVNILYRSLILSKGMAPGKNLYFLLSSLYVFTSSFRRREIFFFLVGMRDCTFLIFLFWFS
uniref:Uncharacterized protein n=1 Tax=Spongospora subterranea TaxID=70186 RepID=A0A0H5QSG7_9EUKA|eukprot:CRZ04983.1 hypothetical protein [Spongospora subterranea]